MASSMAALGTPDQAARSFVADHLDASLAVMRDAAASTDFTDGLVAVSLMLTDSFRAGGKLMIAGNGGSAGDAQHIAGEFVSRLNFDRAPLPAMALTVDTSVLTAIGNDYGYEKVFERQVLGLGRPEDVFLGISTSGRSPNVLRALEAARRIGMKTVGFVGEGDTVMSPLCDLLVAAPSGSTPLIQQIHIVAAHIVCGLVEKAIFRPGTPS